MKKLSIEQKKAFNHVVGSEFKEEYIINSKDNINLYVRDFLNLLDGEQLENYAVEIDAIYNLENGFYSLSNGDFDFYVEISETELSQNILESIEFLGITEDQENYIKEELQEINIAEDEKIILKNTNMVASNGELIQEVVLTNGDIDRHVCYI